MKLKNRMKLPALLLALSLALLPATYAEEKEENKKTAEVSFRSNATTGYVWHGFVMSGDSVLLEDAEGVYVSDPNPELLDGVGGKTVFTLISSAPGRSIVIFTYSFAGEGSYGERAVLLVEADAELNLTVTDVTETGVLEGTVLSANKKTREGLLLTENGKVILLFPEDTELPVAFERIEVFFDGVFTLSEPPKANVIAWGSLAGENARD